MGRLPTEEEIWIFIFAMLFAALSWLGKFLRTATGEDIMSRRKMTGGLIGALLLGFVVASLLMTYLELEPVVVWTASIASGAIGEQATYALIAAVIKSRTGIDLTPKEEVQK